MKIYLPKNLEWMRGKVEFERERALNLRKSLGVRVPEGFETYVNYGDKEGALGRQNSEGVILNVFEMLFEKSTPPQKKKFKEFFYNFNLLKEIFEVGDLEIDSILENPGKREFMLNGSPTPFNISPLNREKNSVEKLIKKTNKSMREGIGLLKKNLSYLNWKVYAHEIDHVDFSNGLVFQDFQKIKGELKKVFSRENQKKEDLEEICNLKKEEIGLQIWIHPAMEARGFYSEFDFNKFDEESFLKTKAEIKRNLLGYYTQSFHNENILSYLIAANNKYDVSTTNYLISKFGKREIKLDPKKVDYKLAVKIYYGELPKYYLKIAQNSLKVVDATGEAFLQDPSRLEIACENATNFKDYLDILKGAKTFS